MQASPTSRSQTPMRWAILALACIAMLGSYYSYDIPGALKDQIQAELNLDDFHQNLLYSVYSFPNTVLPLFGGFFVDRLGTNITLFTFCFLITAGQALFAFGVSIKSYAVMIVGRILFGLGGESQGVAQTTLVALWFESKDLALALGINLSISRLGSVWNDNMSPYMYNHYGLSGAVWFGLGVCVLSLVSTIILIILDRRTNAQLEAAQAQYQLAPLETEPPVRLTDLKDMSGMYWLITASCVVVYSAVLPFNGVASSILQQRFHRSLNEADALLGIPFIISASASPFLGGIVDRLGYRAVLLLVSTAVLAGAHALIGYVDTLTPVVGLVMVGIGYSVYAAAIWPSVNFVVEKSKLGTAYGLITAVQNAGLAAVPLLVGYIKDSTGSWTWVETFFLGLAGLGGVIGVILNVLDAKTGNKLNRSYYKDADASSGPDENTPINNAAGGEPLLSNVSV